MDDFNENGENLSDDELNNLTSQMQDKILIESIAPKLQGISTSLLMGGVMFNLPNSIKAGKILSIVSGAILNEEVLERFLNLSLNFVGEELRKALQAGGPDSDNILDLIRNTNDPEIKKMMTDFLSSNKDYSEFKEEYKRKDENET